MRFPGKLQVRLRQGARRQIHRPDRSEPGDSCVSKANSQSGQSQLMPTPFCCTCKPYFPSAAWRPLVRMCGLPNDYLLNPEGFYASLRDGESHGEV